MAPYFCMGFTLLSVMTEDGPITVNEADYIVIDDNGNLSIDRDRGISLRITFREFCEIFFFDVAGPGTLTLKSHPYSPGTGQR